MVLKKGAIMNLIKGFRLLRVLLLAAILLFPLSSCTTFPERKVKPVKPDYTVAVLPLYNVTNDIDGPVLVRRVFDKKLQKYYKTKPLNEVDELLRDQMGITLGGQLEMTTAQKLGEVLGVDAVIYGYLLNFDDIKTVAYNVRKVRAGFKMVDTKSGRTIWARGGGVKGINAMSFPSFATQYEEIPKNAPKRIEDIPGINTWNSWDDKNLDALLFSELQVFNVSYFAFGVDLIGKVFNVHLISETKVMVNDIMRTMGTEVRAAAVVSQEAEIPRLFFPAYSVFEGRDFSAVVAMTIENKSTQESKIGLVKVGDKLRSNRLSGTDRLAVIVKRGEKKGYLLYPEKKKFIEVSLTDPQFKDIKFVKEFVGEDNITGRPCDKYKMKVIYSDGYIQEGQIWEAKDLNGLVIRADFVDKDYRVLVELKDVSFETPPASLFEVPEGYTKIDY